MPQDIREEYLLTFGTPVAEIEAHALTDTLSALTTAVEEINQALYTGKQISIRIKPFDQASFEVPFELVEVVIAGILSAPHLPSIPEIIKVLREFIELKIQLKGKRPEKVESKEKELQLITQDGDVLHVDRVVGDLVVNNIQINNSFNRSMSRLAEDQTVERLELQDNQRKRLVSVDREAFTYFGSPETSSSEGKKVREVRALLNVRKIVFDFTSKWGFYYDGVKISAKILDHDFLEKAQTEGRFGNGDVLDVLLRIHQEFEKAVNTFVNKEYEIVEVLDHIPRPRDQELFAS